VRVFNLGAAPAALKLAFALSPTDPAAGSAALDMKSVPVGPGASAEVVVNIPAARLKADKSGLCQLTVNAGNGIAPVAMNFIMQQGLPQQLAAHKYQFALPIAELNRWKENSAGHGTFSKPETGGWAYDVTFGGGDKWAFPRFTPPQEVNWDKVEAVLIRARCQAPGIVRIMTFDAQARNSYTAFPVIKADGEWHVALVPLDSFLQPQPGQKIGHQIHDLSVGLNSDTATNRLEVSDLYLLGE
jgi:hypothetical protein